MFARRPLLATLIALLLALVIPASIAAQGPERTLALGVAMDQSRDLATLDAFTASLNGQSPAIWTLWNQWGGTETAFPPTELLDGIVARGAVPMINWEPVNPLNLDSTSFRYRRIVDGFHDDYIREYADAAAAWGGIVLLRFAHEMNGNWFPWGIGRFDNTPARFIAAWRHIHDIFEARGATNVKFVWSPYTSCSWCTPYPKIYPGNRYVDYTGFSGFNWARRNNWISMVTLFSKPVSQLLNVAPKKKIIVTETGTSPNGGDKATWIRKGYPAAYTAFPAVVAVVWFNIKIQSHPDWRLDVPASALRAYEVVGAKPRFQGRFVQ